ncbi:MAG: T9SS type A sorting domain-containing protein [Ignavibacteria bacterium]|nr:T9SS type A sorting domain-containing protein [Ignavibacteria bacterium]
MKYKISKFGLFCAFLLIFSVYHSNAQYFIKSYDLPPFTTKTEYGYSIEKNFDGTVIGKWSIAGVSNSVPNAGSFDWMFLKLTNSGTVTCAALLGFSLADSCFSHIQQSSLPRRNVLAGFYRAPNGREKASFSMLDTNCFHYLSKQILDSLRHEYRQVVKDPSDAFTMAGYIQTYISPGDYKNHILASQYSSAGVLMWAFNYLPPFPWVDERAFSVTYQPVDGTYAITGITNRFTGAGGPYQVFIMKVTAAGLPIWYKGYSPMPGAPCDAKKIIAMPDGGFVVTGNSTAFDPLGDIYVIRVTSAGAVLWQNTYGVPGVMEQSQSIIYQSSDMSLVFTGSAAPAGSTEDIILSKITSAAGAPVWTRRYPNSAGVDRGYDLKEASSPIGYSVTGKLYHSTSVSDDPFFLKTDALGNVTAVCQDSTNLQPRPGQWSGDCARQIYQLTDVQIQPQTVNPTTAERSICGTVTGINSNNEIPKGFILKQNYPNPFNPSTKIEFSLPEDGKVSLRVYDLSGKEVSVVLNSFKQKGNYSIDFDASEFSGGVYFYELKSGSYSETKKMVLIK